MTSILSLFSKALMPMMLLISSAVMTSHAENTQDRQSYKIYIDKEGVMRRNDTKEEVSYYGTNYTLPFAHAYRAMGYLGKDRKEAIDRDVYHLKRLGFNGFRLHLWDVELADSAGNLLSNDHLDLLDYLIARLEDNGIDIVLTAQTNFGNGYPEKNIDTGAFTYDYDKCNIHENKEAQKIQANYLEQLASHVNPYTGRSYSDDNAIIAIEINNEPCHSGTKKEVTDYINKMVKALKKGGFDKPILYNVSHNGNVTEAYYDADIQGTTYQWYPTGLVAGRERKGNFLPNVDEYDIPWKDTIKNFGKMARFVYEFDPGDVLYSYLYPAIARTFRKEGFQWITQFAYDPTDMAQYNTEYQTHFLNLAYTPAKALSMLIAGEAARNIPRGADFGSLPNDTVFGDFTVSYLQDLSLYNTPEKFYYSNNTEILPRDAAAITNIAGHGSSPAIKYEGTGAYFLDKTELPGVWRLEVMPDVMIVSDPFEKPSLRREVAKTVYANQDMTINLPALGDDFSFRAINTPMPGKTDGEASAGTITVTPGVYLLARDRKALDNALASESFISDELKSFVVPPPSEVKNIVVHNPRKYINPEGDLEITAQVFGSNKPEKVTLYPSTVSFWREHNDTFELQPAGGYNYKTVIPADKLGYNDQFEYNIVVTDEGEDTTWPDNTPGNPLDWDFTQGNYYVSEKVTPSQPLKLLKPEKNDRNIDTAMIPEAWDFRFTFEENSPISPDYYKLESTPSQDGLLAIRRYVGAELKDAPQLSGKREIVIKMKPGEGMEETQISLVGKNGATYSSQIMPYQVPDVKLHSESSNGSSLFRVPLTALSQTPTLIIPAPYPGFLNREIELDGMPFNPREIDFVEISLPTRQGRDISSLIEGIWLE